MKKVIFLSMLLAFCMLAYGQTYRIEGTVIDKTSHYCPLKMDKVKN